MKTVAYLILSFISIFASSQVGINTQNPEATLEVVGKPYDLSHFDGIIPPRITGDQLAAKFYPVSKKGSFLFVTKTPGSLAGQVENIKYTGLYFFDGRMWQPVFSNDGLQDVVSRGNTSSEAIVIKRNLQLDFDDKENYVLGNSNTRMTGLYNSIVATDAKISSGQGNTALGYALSQAEVTGKLNLGLGVSALNGISNGIMSGNRNIGIGAGSMSYLTSGNDNISIGYLSGTANRTGSNNIFIGIGAGSPALGDRSVSNKLAIHSTPVSTSPTSLWDTITNNYTDYKFALISGDFSERWLNINGKLSVTPSQMLNADGDADFTKRVVAKEDGTFGFAKEILPPPPVKGNFILKSVDGVIYWSTE